MPISLWNKALGGTAEVLLFFWCGIYLRHGTSVMLGPKPGPYLDPCWSWENSIICPAISRSCKLGYRLFRKSSKSLLLPEGITSDIPYLKREEENRVLLGLKRLEALLALRYLASAPGAAEMYLPLPFVSPPVGYRIEKLECMLREPRFRGKCTPPAPLTSLHHLTSSMPLCYEQTTLLLLWLSQGPLTNLEGNICTKIEKEIFIWGFCLFGGCFSHW